ncbi:MAG TPA: choice-of-anchor Q domain-containing protein, partial [Tepidisphaeraceae bacterium]
NGSGGGLSAAGVSPNIILDSMVFTNNNANGNGGAIALTNNSSLTIRNSTIDHNTASALGGGIFFFQGGSLLMQHCQLTFNTANGVSGHDASGGAIYFDGAALPSPPAGYTANTLVVQSTSFTSNTGSHGGGAIAVDQFIGTLLAQNCNIAANIAGTSGGGVFCDGASGGTGSVTLQDCTIAINNAQATTSGTGGGGIARVGSFPGSISLTGSIVCDNFISGVPSVVSDLSASPFSTTNANFSDIGSATGYTLSGSSGNNLPIGTDPGLSGLLTALTFGPNSPAINAGTAISGITTDEFGTARPQGPAPDIGAYERPATAATLTSMSYEFQTQQSVTFNFSDDASVTFSRSSYSILDRTTNQVLPSGTGDFGFNFDGKSATLVLTNVLSDGNYRVTSGGMTLDFFVLNGDANRDRKVDQTDLGILSLNWGQIGRTFSQGNFDYSPDGLVNVNDLNILASHWQQSLAAPVLSPAPPPRTPARGPVSRIFDDIHGTSPSPVGDLGATDDLRKLTI